MDREQYTSLAKLASDLVEVGERLKAIELLEHLVQSDLPEYDRAMMCMNIAIIHDQLGDSNQALEAYSRAVELESWTESYFVAQNRAAYYSELAEYEQSLRCYEELLWHRHLKTEDRDIFLKNIETLKKLVNESSDK